MSYTWQIKPGIQQIFLTCPGLFAGQDPTRRADRVKRLSKARGLRVGSGQGVFGFSRVDSVGSGQDAYKSRGSGRVA